MFDMLQIAMTASYVCVCLYLNTQLFICLTVCVFFLLACLCDVKFSLLSVEMDCIMDLLVSIVIIY